MKLTFFGATETVTGSRFLLEHAGLRLLVDCGLYQGVKALRQRNWNPLPFDVKSLDAVVLTHAHIDHSGYLPLLYRNGFRGPVYATQATRDLCAVLLPDSGYLQEEQAGWLNKRKRTRHTPALPLYTQADAEACLSAFRPTPFNEWIRLRNDVQMRLTPAGHIIGSACVTFKIGGKTLAFTGDLGRPKDPVMRPPTPLKDVDYLVCESTYGNRRHSELDPRIALRDIILETAERRGILLIPAFAVGRSQTLLHLITQLKNAGEIPDVPVFLNSPMAIRATKIFCDHVDEHRLGPDECEELDSGVTFVRSAEESKKLTLRQGPIIVVSASGMATGGRILHHLKTALLDPRNTVLFAGFQAAGTRGEALTSGVDEVKIHGEYIPVRAQIAQINGLSVHADYKEIVDWLKPLKPPKRVFLVHGEPSAQDSLRRYMKDLLGWTAEIPSYGDQVELNTNHE